MVFAIIVGLLATVSTLVCGWFCFSEFSYVVHHPECKSFGSFVLVTVFTVLSFVVLGTVVWFLYAIAADHGWWAKTIETLGAFSLAGYCVYKMYRTTDFHIDHVDYDAIMGKRPRRHA